MKKSIVFTLIIALSCIATKAQTIDERIGYAMNSSDFFGLYDGSVEIQCGFCNPDLSGNTPQRGRSA